MRALLQRVTAARVCVAGETVGAIEQGLLVYVSVARDDTAARGETLARKVAAMRIFPDAEGKLNRSVGDVGGSILVIPNFSLLADTRKGRRPSFAPAAGSELARPLQEAFVRAVSQQGVAVACGRFGADMAIESVADGPINILVEV